jgi:ADP-ribose pyrophosphatase YjhB (NUDIX family)
MNYIDEINKYKPINEQEVEDKGVILDYIESFPDNVLFRENKIAHMTSSSVIINREHTKMLMIHHNIYNTWTWTGGHCDGEEDLLKLALREANEETGIKSCVPLGGIGSIDALIVHSHIKRGKYVNAHLHLNVAYVFEADEKEALILNEDETSGLKWVPIEEVRTHSCEEEIIYVYHKLFKSVGIYM